MALDRSNRYPGRFENPTTAQPQGAFKNRTSPTAEDGSYFEADWANDMSGFFAKILNVAGVTPNGTVDNGSSSQLYDAMLLATPGRLINVQVFTAGGQYTPSAGMNFILAHMIGGGGASGGTPATSSSQTGGVAAGNSGAYAYIKAYASDIGAGKAVSVGAGGKSQVNGAGFSGGTTAIADIADVTGGYGSGPGSVSATAVVAQPSYDKPVINKYNKTEVLAFSLGSQAWNFLQAATGTGTGWLSPASPFPGGERGRGGSGIFVNASSAAQAGLAGNDGTILIMEYA